MNTNDIKELIVKDNPNAKKDKKRLIAFFIMKNGKTKKTKFGMFRSKGTFSDGASEEKKENYIKRHKVRENFNDVFSAGSLSRYILWNFRSNNELEKFYNREFKIPKVKIQFKRYKIMDTKK
tara:strand:+ start:453 stop:818 length:366 start_codon:yes stop_codon:yes gene_type:complete